MWQFSSFAWGISSQFILHCAIVVMLNPWREQDDLVKSICDARLEDKILETVFPLNGGKNGGPNGMSSAEEDRDNEEQAEEGGREGPPLLPCLCFLL